MLSSPNKWNRKKHSKAMEILATASLVIWWQQDATVPSKNELQCGKHLRLCRLCVLICTWFLSIQVPPTVLSDYKWYTTWTKPKHISPGPDKLHPFALKATAAEILPMLTHILQQSLNCGRLPAQWKHAYLCTPVYKKGNSADPRNYRPISLTSVICKTMEHIILNQSIKHTESSNIIAESQFGITGHHSCKSQLHSKNCHVIVIFLCHIDAFQITCFFLL